MEVELKYIHMSGEEVMSRLKVVFPNSKREKVASALRTKKLDCGMFLEGEKSVLLHDMGIREFVNGKDNDETFEKFLEKIYATCVEKFADKIDKLTSGIWGMVIPSGHVFAGQYYHENGDFNLMVHYTQNILMITNSTGIHRELVKENAKMVLDFQE